MCFEIKLFAFFYDHMLFDISLHKYVAYGTRLVPRGSTLGSSTFARVLMHARVFLYRTPFVSFALLFAPGHSVRWRQSRHVQKLFEFP